MSFKLISWFAFTLSLLIFLIRGLQNPSFLSKLSPNLQKRKFVFLIFGLPLSLMFLMGYSHFYSSNHIYDGTIEDFQADWSKSFTSHHTLLLYEKNTTQNLRIITSELLPNNQGYSYRLTTTDPTRVLLILDFNPQKKLTYVELQYEFEHPADVLLEFKMFQEALISVLSPELTPPEIYNLRSQFGGIANLLVVPTHSIRRVDAGEITYTYQTLNSPYRLVFSAELKKNKYPRSDYILEYDPSTQNSKSSTINETASRKTATSNSFQNQEFDQFIFYKDSFDKEIAEISEEVNSRIKNDRLEAPDLKDKADSCLLKIRSKRNDLNSSGSGFPAEYRLLASQLLNLYDLEIIRITKIRDALQSGSSSQQYLPHFKAGGEAATEFEKENVIFTEKYLGLKQQKALP